MSKMRSERPGGQFAYQQQTQFVRIFQILAVRSACLQLSTWNLLQAFRIKSDKQQGCSDLFAFRGVLLFIAFSAFHDQNGQDKARLTTTRQLHHF